MKVVIDTNVLLVAIGRKSKYHWIFECLLVEEFTLLVTTSILLEYHEIITRKIDDFTAGETLKLLLSLPNIELIEVFYNWNLIEKDKDDNAFIDCAVAGGADFLVTEDAHFNILKNIDFPKVAVLNIQAFQQELENRTL